MEDKESKEQEIIQVAAMANTPGWGHFKRHIEEGIAKSRDISTINTEDDQKILYSVKCAQSRKDTLQGLLNWIKERQKKGGSNG